MAIDGDGANGQTSAPVYAPHGYTPEPLDYLANAGSPGNWYGIVTNRHGDPIVQSKLDPAPGAYVSATSYAYKGHEREDPRAYLDSNAVAYIVIPSHWRGLVDPIVLGCKAMVTDTKTGNMLSAIVGDFGPRNKWGEASIAVAKFFGIPHSPKNGGTESAHFRYTFWPGVKNGYDLIPA